MVGNCETCAVIDDQKCPFNQPPLIDGFEHLDAYKHRRIDCEHHIPKTTVVNIHKIKGVSPRYDVYIGRYSRWAQHEASIWANPYPVKKYGIKESLRLYEIHVRHSRQLMELLPRLNGKRLGCWCKPEPCHGDVLIKLLEEIDNGK